MSKKFDVDKIKEDLDKVVIKPSRRKRQRKRKWEATEAAISFNFSALVRKIKNDILRENRGIPRDVLSEKIYENLKEFTLNEQTFEYTSVGKLSYGGARWYILCPKCKKPSNKLYLPKLPDREQLYLCQKCHMLKPSSLLYEGNKKYQIFTKPLKQLEKIRKKLLKRGITMTEAKQLLEEHEQIEKQLSNTPEYRLWKFHQEHGNLP